MKGQTLARELAPEQQDDGIFAVLGREFFEDPSLGRELAFKVGLASEMKLGADAHLRPSVRRDKFKAAAKAIRRLQSHVRELDAITIADALGRVTPEPVAAGRGGDRIDGWSELPVAAVVPSDAPALLAEYAACLTTLDRLAAGFDALGTRTRPERRGADETPDSLMFALEGIEALWRQHRADQPSIMGFKRGGFGDLTLRALRAGGGPFTQAEIRTGLRRLKEWRARQT